MKDKEKQITKMAKEMSKELCCYYDKQKKKCTNCFGMEEDCDLHCNFGRTLERLSKAGYQKIDKDKVVLPREEYERLKRAEAEKDRLYEIKLDLENKLIEKGWTEYEGADEIEKRVSKETAEKILERGKYCMPSGLRDWIVEQFGVEIKEN